MNFKINDTQTIKNRILDINEININNIAKQIYEIPNLVFYVTKNKKFLGVITQKNLLSVGSNIENALLKDHPTVNNMEESTIVYNLAIEHNTVFVPIIKDNKIHAEYQFESLPNSLLSMDNERFKKLYNEGNILINYLNFISCNKISILGTFAETIKNYIISKSDNFEINIINNNLNAFLDAIKKDCLIIDTNNDLAEFKISLLNNLIPLRLAHKNCKYTTLYDICNFAELYNFKNYIEQKNIETFFFRFPNTDKFKNLNLQEKYRIAFDNNHYRYYYNNMDQPEILELVKRVYGDMYSEEFIKSRNELSGLTFKNGIPYLLDSSNNLCKANSGSRFTTDKTSFYNYCICTFGSCFVYGSCVDDQHTLASCLQRLVNKKMKDYELYNYGSRNLTVFESIRIARNLHINSNDKFIFVLTEPEMDEVEKFNFKNIFNLQELFDNYHEHDYFLDEPLHCNHKATEKIGEYIYNIIDPKLKLKPKANDTTPVQEKNIFTDEIDNFKTQIEDYIKYFNKYKVDCNYASVILTHANPFTLGHFKLVEYASKRSDHVYVLVSTESGMFAPDDVYKMTKDSCSIFKNVTVIPDRTDIIDRKLFLPGYFERDENPNASGNTTGIIDFIGKIVKPALNIQERFLGSEPVDLITRRMNQESVDLLPKYGIKTTIIPRFENSNGIPFSGKTVRNALKRGDWETINQMVPEATAKILKKYETLI